MEDSNNELRAQNQKLKNLLDLYEKTHDNSSTKPATTGFDNTEVSPQRYR